MYYQEKRSVLPVFMQDKYLNRSRGVSFCWYVLGLVLILLGVLAFVYWPASAPAKDVSPTLQSPPRRQPQPQQEQEQEQEQQRDMSGKPEQTNNVQNVENSPVVAKPAPIVQQPVEAERVIVEKVESTIIRTETKTCKSNLETVTRFLVIGDFFPLGITGTTTQESFVRNFESMLQPPENSELVCDDDGTDNIDLRKLIREKRAFCQPNLRNNNHRFEFVSVGDALDTSAETLTTLKSVLSTSKDSFDYIFIWTGANDLLNEKPESVASNLKLMIDHCRESRPMAKVAIFTIPDIQKQGHTLASTIVVNKKMQELRQVDDRLILMDPYMWVPHHVAAGQQAGGLEGDTFSSEVINNFWHGDKYLTTAGHEMVGSIVWINLWQMKTCY